MSVLVRQQAMMEIPQLRPRPLEEFHRKNATLSHYDTDSPDLNQAMQYARQRLHELSPHLTYHSLWHTWHDVLPAVDRLIMLEGVAGEDALLLRTAAIYHDIGFVVQVNDHEMVSAQIADCVLPGFGYSPRQIERVHVMIMATQLPQTPQDTLSQILADADLDVLGRDDFWPRNKALRAEMMSLGKCCTDHEWCTCQLNFLRSHAYFTASAKKLRGAQKQRNMAFLRARIAKC